MEQNQGKMQGIWRCQKPGTWGEGGVQILLFPKLSQAGPVLGSWAPHAGWKEETRGLIQTHSPKGQVWGHQTGAQA